MLRYISLVLLLFAVAAARPDERNQVEDWCDDGIKHDNLSGPSYTVEDPPDGTTWTLLVLKSGTVHETFSNPLPDETYTPGNGHDVSYVILCYEDDEPPSTTTTVPTTSTTTPESTTSLPPEDTTTTTSEPTTTTIPTTSTTTPASTTSLPPED